MLSLGEIFESIKNNWNTLPLQYRIGGAVLVGAVFFSLLFLTLFSTPDYQPLFTNLQPEDGAAIISLLKENSIPYELVQNGTAILVPEERVYETRMMVASQGLPRGGIVGFEVFSEIRLGETESDRQIRYQAALQGELTRTILQLKEVQDARVHLVLPKRSLFVSESQPASASVLLHLAPGVRLSPSQIRGISHLIATSVEGLVPENITIVDTSGNILNEISSNNGLDGQLIADKLDIERQYERGLENRIVAGLERIYGYGNVVVRVSSQLDFALVEEYQELYQPINRDYPGLVRDEHRLSESYLSTGSDGVGGVPGVDSNVPGYVADSGERSQYERQESSVNYALNLIERKISSSPGSVERLSVSVWVNGDLDPEEITSVKEWVSHAAGLRPDRGDEIFVTSAVFREDSFLAVTADVQPAESPIWIYWLLGALLVLIVVIILIRRRSSVVVDQETTSEIDLVVGGQEEEKVEVTLSPEEQERLEIQNRIKDLAKDKPEDFAQLLKAWLAED